MMHLCYGYSHAFMELWRKEFEGAMGGKGAGLSPVTIIAYRTATLPFTGECSFQ